jgi:hypothetical protein
MAAKIGILGESTTTSTGTHTVYTVPTDKAARIRIMFMCKGVSGDVNFGALIGSPGTQKQIIRPIGNNSYCYTGVTDSTAQLDTSQGVYTEVMGDYTAAANARCVVVPWAHDFYLSDGDTVRTFIATNTSPLVLFQVLGVEDDA